LVLRRWAGDCEHSPGPWPIPDREEPTMASYLPAVREADDASALAIYEEPESNPALVYLRSLAPGSRPTMTSALRTVVGILGYQDDIWGFPWGNLRYAHTSAIRTALAERYAPAQANKCLSAVKGVLKAAWRLEQISDADYLRAVDVDAVKGSSAQVGRAVDMDEIERMLKVCAADPSPAGSRDAAIFAVGYGCGLRRGELAGLDVADWSQREAALTVRRGKGGKSRVVYLNEGGTADLTAWIRVRGRHTGALFQPVNRGGRIQRQRRLSGAAISDIVGRRAREAGIESVRAHDLRRSHISALLDAGVDLATVQQMAGHASPVVTAGYDRRPERARKAAAQLLGWPS
jgi:integrase